MIYSDLWNPLSPIKILTSMPIRSGIVVENHFFARFLVHKNANIIHNYVHYTKKLYSDIIS